MIQLQLFLEKNDLTNQLPINFSFRVDNAKFLKFGRLHLCKTYFWEKVAFLGGTAKIWSVIIRNVNGKFRANFFCVRFFFLNLRLRGLHDR